MYYNEPYDGTDREERVAAMYNKPMVEWIDRVGLQLCIMNLWWNGQRGEGCRYV